MALYMFRKGVSSAPRAQTDLGSLDQQSRTHRGWCTRHIIVMHGSCTFFSQSCLDLRRVVRTMVVLANLTNISFLFFSIPPKHYIGGHTAAHQEPTAAEPRLPNNSRHAHQQPRRPSDDIHSTCCRRRLPAATCIGPVPGTAPAVVGASQPPTASPLCQTQRHRRGRPRGTSPAGKTGHCRRHRQTEGVFKTGPVVMEVSNSRGSTPPQGGAAWLRGGADGQDDKRSGAVGWGTTVRRLSGLSLCVCERALLLVLRFPASPNPEHLSNSPHRQECSPRRRPQRRPRPRTKSNHSPNQKPLEQSEDQIQNTPKVTPQDDSTQMCAT